MKAPRWLPTEIYNLIVFDFCPDALHQYLQTCLNNHFAWDVRYFVYPSARYNSLLRNYDTETLFYFLVRLRRCNLQLKRKKSRKFLKVIDYSDFPEVEKRLYHYSISHFFGLIKPQRCSRRRTVPLQIELGSSSRA